ncbi:hypothetical protein [Halorubrum sp. Atlit-26R]|uniref:hypothetical protein n=1 Tax=Halorubrum sp. Atlit-26R TaxID=2282128 RepID=UPI000EF17E8D|nr:hypothetical protein [Halorubrum sp. Atlit-26R]RLM68492.1 hypothetical protein DVK07_10235 [Halorubrum sp. Atlit-26R]
MAAATDTRNDEASKWNSEREAQEGAECALADVVIIQTASPEAEGARYNIEAAVGGSHRETSPAAEVYVDGERRAVVGSSVLAGTVGVTLVEGPNGEQHANVRVDVDEEAGA